MRAPQSPPHHPGLGLGLYVLPACVNNVCAVPMEEEKGCQMPWDWSYRLLRATICLLKTEFKFSVEAASAIISPAHPIPYS